MTDSVLLNYTINITSRKSMTFTLKKRQHRPSGPKNSSFRPMVNFAKKFGLGHRDQATGWKF